MLFSITLSIITFDDYNGRLCVEDSVIPGAAPLVSFWNRGTCSSKKKPFAVTEGSIAKIIGRVLTTSGFKVVDGRTENLTLIYTSRPKDFDYDRL